VHNAACITDRPERGLDSADFPEHDRALHLVYTHGSILRHNAASTTVELSDLTRKNAQKIAEYLKSKDLLVIGYGGWDDSLMSALTWCDKTCHRIYWCNVHPADEAEANLAPAVRELLHSYAGQAYYVPLGAGGADGFMRDLYRALAPNNAIPLLFRDPFKVFAERFAGLKLGNTVFGADDLQTLGPRTLPLPRLERSVQSMYRSALAMLGYASAGFGYGKDDGPLISNSLAAGRESSLLERGFLLALSGNNEQAVTLWTQIVESATPGLKDLVVNEAAIAANYIGVVQSREGKLELAVGAHTRACELVFAYPTLLVDSLNYRGAAHQQMGQTDAAIEDFSRAIAIWNEHRPAVSVTSIGRALIFRGLTRQWSGQSGAQDDFNEARQLKKLSRGV
jgi:tetratricopeptide (TPR) repeat protein